MPHVCVCVLAPSTSTKTFNRTDHVESVDNGQPNEEKIDCEQEKHELDQKGDFMYAETNGEPNSTPKSVIWQKVAARRKGAENNCRFREPCHRSGQ